MNARLFFKRNASTILTVLGGIGVVATTITAVKATPKALQKLEEAETEKGEMLTKWEVVQVAGPTYLPTILLGTSTLACIFGANVLTQRQQAALVSAYGLIDQKYKDYRRKLIELHGKEAHDEIIEQLAIEKAEDRYISGTGMFQNCSLYLDDFCGEPVLFYDDYSNRYFESTIEQVLNAEYHTNRNFVLRGYVILNEFYDFLGLESTNYGSEVGWCIDDELYWVDFNHRKITLDDGLECYVIETPWGPSADFMDDTYY